MKNPPQLRFIGMEHSAAVESCIRDKIAKLDQFRPDLYGCHVTLELLDRQARAGRCFAVRIDVTAHGSTFVVDRVRHEDAYVALHEAFDDMRRQLQDSVGRMQDARRDAANLQP